MYRGAGESERRRMPLEGRVVSPKLLSMYRMAGESERRREDDDAASH
jgi:hypothetical protein